MTATVESFLADWCATTTEKPARKREFENFLVEISASARPNTIRINSIFSTTPRSNKLKVLLEWLVTKADQHKVVLTTCAQPFGWNRDEMPPKEKIKEIFERYGFEAKFEYPDNDGYEMIRKLK